MQKCIQKEKCSSPTPIFDVDVFFDLIQLTKVYHKNIKSQLNHKALTQAN